MRHPPPRGGRRCTYHFELWRLGLLRGIVSRLLVVFAISAGRLQHLQHAPQHLGAVAAPAALAALYKRSDVVVALQELVDACTGSSARTAPEHRLASKRATRNVALEDHCAAFA
jgi:hypothetical protein